MNIIQKISQDNLSTYFILPLLKLSKISFINSNFVNSYLTRQGRHIVVQVYDVTLLSRALYKHPNFKNMYIKEGFYYLCYEIPKEWKKDVDKFLSGKYSRMSNHAHTMIKDYSGLSYKDKSDPKKTKTHILLLALDRDPILRNMWVNELGLLTNALDDDDELLQGVSEKFFIDIESLKKYP